MGTLRSIFVTLAVMLAPIWTSGTAEAQVADTIVVTIQGDVSQVLLTWEDFDIVRIGDTIHLRAQALDSEGDPVNAAFYWASEDSTILRIEEQPDGRAVGIAIRKGTVRVWVMVEPVTSLDVAVLQSDGTLDWGKQLEFTALGQENQLCAYLHRAGTLVAESPGPPTCPTVFLAASTPAMWPGPVIARSVPWSRLMALAGG